MSDAVLIIDAQNRIVDLNPSAQQMLGLDVSQAVGRQVNQILPDQLNPDHISEEPGAAFSAVAYVQGEEEVYYDISITSLNDGHGALAGRLVVFHNITDRKRLEQQIQEAYDKEAAAHRELAAEMTRRVEFTRALIHELKTPLPPMVASSRLLVDEAKDARSLSLAKNIYHGASKLSYRIDELLDVARGEMGVLEVNPKEMDLLPLLYSVAEVMAPMASSAGISIELELPPFLPEVNADEGRLRQVLNNLFNNALKWTPEEGKVSLRARVDDNALVVEVEDTGAGIAEADRQRLFDIYYRGESNGPRLDGLGVGLSLCKRIVELQGGQIWVESEKGKGSTFGFSIPLATEDQSVG